MCVDEAFLCALAFDIRSSMSNSCHTSTIENGLRLEEARRAACGRHCMGCASPRPDGARWGRSVGTRARCLPPVMLVGGDAACCRGVGRVVLVCVHVSVCVCGFRVLVGAWPWVGCCGICGRRGGHLWSCCFLSGFVVFCAGRVNVWLRFVRLHLGVKSPCGHWLALSHAVVPAPSILYQ